MAVNQPDGDSATSLNPPDPAAASLWTEEYAADFTDLGAHDFTSTAAKTLNGVEWTAVNADDSSKFELTASTGLEIDPTGNNASASWWNDAQTLPYLWASIDDMCGGDYSPDLDTVALQLHMDSATDPTASYNAYGLGVQEGATANGANKYISLRRVGVGGAKKYGCNRNNVSDNEVIATQATFFEIVFFPGNSYVCSMGVFASSFPDPLLTTSTFASKGAISSALGPGGGSGGSAEAAPSWPVTSSASFVINAQLAASSGTFATTAYKMRLLRRKTS